MTHAGGGCDVHAYHSPRPQDVDLHHILPKFMGGPDEESNMVRVCPTGHRNVHLLLAEYLRIHAKPPWAVLRQYGGDERYLAQDGWDRYMEGLP